MKLLYQGDTPLDSMLRKHRRARFKDICWEAVGALAFLAACWLFIVLMFCM